MFYSHDILTNSQFGVATIWLVATVGKTSQKRFSRKVIQDVDVPKACDKIIHPGAPLALRLQGNLLYGVSRVFAHQCGYVLSDAERIQTEMLSFFKSFKQSELDPQAGKTKRHLITLQDDPNFHPIDALPRMDFLDWDLDVVFQSQMSSANKYSQFTPLGSQHSISSGRHASNVSINLPDSSHGSIRMPSDFGQLSPFKPFQLQGPDGSDHNPFGDDDLGGVALDIDADGNVIGIFGEEPELPPLPTPSAAHGEINLPGAQAHHVLQSEDQPFIMNEELILPDAEAFPRTQPAPQQRHAHTISETQSSEVEQGAAPSRRGRRRKANVMFDARDCLSSREMREMRDNYLEHMDEQRKKRKTRGAPHAKQNAEALLYGNGIANVGIFLDFDTQLEHPLAGQFAGNTLMESLLGIDMSGDKRKTKGRRRGRSAAFSDDEEDEQRVEKQQKLDVAEVEQFLHGSDGHPSFADDTAPELGLEAGGALDDRHSSTMMPWSRAGSVVPGSSVRGSAKKPSPMPGRAGSIIHSVERYSDIGDAAFGSDGHFPPNGS